MLRCDADQHPVLTGHRHHFAKPPTITCGPHRYVQHDRPFASRTYYDDDGLTYPTEPIRQGLDSCDAEQHARVRPFTYTKHVRCYVAMPTNMPC